MWNAIAAQNKMSTGVAFADHWAGPYRRLGSAPIDGIPGSW